MIQYSIEDNIALVAFNMEGYPMNVLNEDSIRAFAEAMEKAIQDEAVKGIIITSARKEFVAGADLRMLLKSAGLAQSYEMIWGLHQVFRRYEACGKPVVAAINGTALGGGYEICLACHHRIALNDAKTQIGLPEILIGLFPGGGGTQRLPRMIGIEQALPLLLEGKKMNPEKALKAGLINDLAGSREELIQKAKAWILANPRAKQPWDDFGRDGKLAGISNYKVPGGNVQSPKGVQTFIAGTALMRNKTQGNYPAADAIMSCVYEGLQVPIEHALQIEAKHFAKVANTPEAKNMIRSLFFAMNEANKGAARPKDVPVTDLQKVGILGAGMMGAGIAYVSAVAGLQVVLKDVSVEGAEKGKDYSRKLLQKEIERGRYTQAQADEILARIHATDQAKDFESCGLAIEAVFENRELKAKVTQEVEAFLPPNAVFASNTSTLPITGLAEASKNPQSFIGLHFFSPVDKMMLVEIIMGKQTSPEALALCIDYVKKIKKTPIVVNDSRGFYTSRCFGTYTSEGITLLSEGVAPALIENAGKAAGMPVGALDVSDAVALDLMYKIMVQTEKDTGLKVTDTPDGKVVKKFVEELGRVGKREKAGFYEYPEDSPKKLWSGLAEHFKPLEAQPSLEEVKKRLLYRQAIEAVKCFEEGVVTSVRDADLGSILAWGFPPYTGGILSFIDYVGIERFVQEADRLADAYGERFRPTAKLREMAAQKQGFHA
jgi:3-hydroxyacyl-CoA dehydrogenase/enoyl-CoA hydratase/3-hydroxybutyryl-CoA epimerase